MNLDFSPIQPKLYRVTITASPQGQNRAPFRGTVQQRYVGNDLTPAPAEKQPEENKAGE